MLIPFPRLKSLIHELANAGISRGQYSVNTVMDEDDLLLQTWTNDSLYVLLQLSLAQPQLNRSLLDVHAGSVYGARPDPDLFQLLATSTWRADYGGPWARVRSEGVAYGWRNRIPSDIFSEENLGDSFGYVLGMVDAFGLTCERLASAFIPSFGGTRCRADDPNAWPALLGGMLPPD